MSAQRFPTEIHDIDREILLNVDFYTLLKITEINKYLYNLCDSWFWRLRFRKDFIDLGTELDYKKVCQCLAINGKDGLLFAGAKLGCLPLVEYAIKNGVNIFAHNNFALDVAIIHGHLHIIEYFLSDSLIVFSINKEKLLECAIKYGQSAVVYTLVKDYYFPVNCHKKVLVNAYSKNYMDILQLLFSNMSIQRHTNYLIAAIKNDDIQFTKILFELIPTLLIDHTHNKHPFLVAIDHAGTKIVKLILDNLGDDVRANLLRSAVDRVTSKMNIDTIQLLIDNGAPIWDYDHTILYHAVNSQRLDIIRLLLKHDMYKSNLPNNVFIKAAEIGNMEIIRFLLGHGVHIRGQYEAIKQLIERGNSNLDTIRGIFSYINIINGREGINKLLGKVYDHTTETLLTFAARIGSLESVQLLIDCFADIHAYNDDALMTAVAYGRVDIINMLLDKGSDINAQNGLSLYKALERNDINIIKLLISRGANIQAHYKPMLELELGKPNVNKNILRLLLNYGKDIINIGEERLCSETLARDSDFDLICILIDEVGINIHVRQDEPLINASLSGCIGSTKTIKIIQKLLQSGADVHAQNDKALYNAVLKGNIDAVRSLINAGANIHAQNNIAFNQAIIDNNLAIVSLLLDRGIDIHMNGDKALCLAAERNHVNIVEHLLARGANIHAQQDRALISAARCGNIAIVDILLRYGANVYAQNNRALNAAKLHGHRNVVQLLADHIHQKRMIQSNWNLVVNKSRKNKPIS